MTAPAEPQADITPHVFTITWSGSPGSLDESARPAFDLLAAAVDKQLDALAAVPVTTLTRTDKATSEIIGIGTAAIMATDDPLAADVLVLMLDHVADLDEQLQSERMLTSGALSVAYRHHRHITAEREARHAA